MKRFITLGATIALLTSASGAAANEAATNALIDADPEPFTYSESGGTERMAHDNGKLRFQSGGGYTGIAIPGGSNANFENSRLRESGDPAFGSVVEFPEPE